MLVSFEILYLIPFLRFLTPIQVMGTVVFYTVANPEWGWGVELPSFFVGAKGRPIHERHVVTSLNNNDKSVN